VNGRGIGITSKQCLLHPKRNPSLKKDEIETEVKNCLGLNHLIWLNQGLEGDHTDGHIDTIARFVNSDTILINNSRDSLDPNTMAMKDNQRILKQWSQEKKIPLNIVSVPLPIRKLYYEDQRLPINYVNFYFTNEHLIVPQFGDVNDRIALEIIQKEVPKKNVIGLPALEIMNGGGVFNCLTQQVPK